jgi:hypothetical protein
MAKKRSRIDSEEEAGHASAKLASASPGTKAKAAKAPAHKQQRSEVRESSDDVSSSSDSDSSDSSDSSDAESDAGVDEVADNDADSESPQVEQGSAEEENKVDAAIVPTGKGPKVIVVLEHANLEAVKNGKVR